MGRHLHFKMGSFYRQDDRTGFPQRAERTRMEWTGLIVDKKVWEPRQPQDLVKGVQDQQSVPDARPLPPPVFIGPIYVQLSANCPVGTTSLPLPSLVGLNAGDRIGVMLDSGVLFNTTIASVVSSGITIPAPGLPNSAAAGNLITDYSG
jgi:hypothetical protein